MGSQEYASPVFSLRGMGEPGKAIPSFQVSAFPAFFVANPSPSGPHVRLDLGHRERRARREESERGPVLANRHLEDQLELREEIEQGLDKARREIAVGDYTTGQP